MNALLRFAPFALLATFLLAFAGAAQAQSLSGAADAATDKANAAGGLGLSGSGGTAGLDAATEHATGTLDASADASNPVEDEGVWAWLKLNLGAFVAKLGEVFGHAGMSAPSTDANVDVRLTEGGVDVAGNVAGVRLDTGAVDDLQGRLDGIDTGATVEGAMSADVAGHSAHGAMSLISG